MECVLCLEESKIPVVTSCGHVFDFHCLARAMNHKKSSVCPVCRQEIQHLKATALSEEKDNCLTQVSINWNCSYGHYTVWVSPSCSLRNLELYVYLVTKCQSQYLVKQLQDLD
jgi:hypothetical protein